MRCDYARRMEPRSRRDRLDDLARRLDEHNVEVRVIAADLADEKQVVPLLDEVTEMELDLLVNNAALAHYMPFAELPLEAEADRAAAAHVRELRYRRWGLHLRTGSLHGHQRRSHRPHVWSSAPDAPRPGEDRAGCVRRGRSA